MSKTKITQSLLLLLVVMPVSVLARADQKKNNNPPPPPKPAPAARPAPSTGVKSGNAEARPAGGAGQGLKARGGSGGSGGAKASGGGGAKVGGGRGVTGGGVGGVKPGGAGSGASRISYQGRPGEQPTDRPGGGKIYRNPATHQTVTTDAHGNIQRIEAPRGLAGADKMVINRGPRGGRVVETGHPGARVVSYGPNRGFVERRLRPGYISRTYVSGGRSSAHVYREYRYHNVAYYRYVPSVYYSPRFYAWAVSPWGVQLRYGFANPAPWGVFYPGYFTPYAVYSSPDLWLTDYLLADNLRLAYEQAGYESQAPPPPPESQPTAATLTPEVKALITDELRQQLAAAADAAAQPTSPGLPDSASPSDVVPPALNQRFFVVSSTLDVISAGQACTLTGGDIIERRGKEVAQDGTVAVNVVSSKAGDCAAESATAVDLAQLQEMHNQFQETLDSGLNLLANNQAKGQPTVAGTGARPVAEGTAEPVPDAQSQLKTQDDDAAGLEGQVTQGGM